MLSYSFESLPYFELSNDTAHQFIQIPRAFFLVKCVSGLPEIQGPSLNRLTFVGAAHIIFFVNIRRVIILVLPGL